MHPSDCLAPEKVSLAAKQSGSRRPVRASFGQAGALNTGSLQLSFGRENRQINEDGTEKP
jgi:hypothetical protein